MTRGIREFGCSLILLTVFRGSINLTPNWVQYCNTLYGNLRVAGPAHNPH